LKLGANTEMGRRDNREVEGGLEEGREVGGNLATSVGNMAFAAFDCRCMGERLEGTIKQYV
jgi:hypothetical protein